MTPNRHSMWGADSDPNSFMATSYGRGKEYSDPSPEYIRSALVGICIGVRQRQIMDSFAPAYVYYSQLGWLSRYKWWRRFIKVNRAAF